MIDRVYSAMPAPRGAPASPNLASEQPRRLRYLWLWTSIWLVYMIQPIRDAWHQPQLWERVAGVGAGLAFSALYLMAFFRLRATIRSTGKRFGPAVGSLVVGSMLALLAVLVVAVGESALGALVYVSVMAIFTLPALPAWTVVGAMAATVVTLTRLVPGWRPNDDLAFQIGVAALAVWGVLRLVERNAQLAAAREEIAELAVVSERNRFARDLHDLLGHSLTVVSVKAELAGRLVRRAPERAEIELAEIQRLAREALTDVRSAVGGYREVSLGAELARARSALTAAGIEPVLPADAGAVPENRHELFGWAVREGVTNVVRHSGAEHCWVRLTAGTVEISDDGRGPGAPAGVGHGLVGLRERVAAAGGTLTVGRSAEGGYSLRVSVP
jgi:two-component system sensor histidine kinase DesK